MVPTTEAEVPDALTGRPLGAFIARALTTLVIPQGYTLSIAGSIAVGVRRYGFPTTISTIAFVAGAVAAFVLLGGLVATKLRNPADIRLSFWACVNVMPIVTIAIVIGGVQIIPNPAAGFAVAGFLAAGSYIALVSGFLNLVGRPNQVRVATRK